MADIWNTIKGETEENVTIVYDIPPTTVAPAEMTAVKIREVMALLRDPQSGGAREIAAVAKVKTSQVKIVRAAMAKRLDEINVVKAPEIIEEVP